MVCKGLKIWLAMTDIRLCCSYIVDFEDCFWDKSAEWHEADYFFWNLAKTVSATEDKW